MTESQRKLEPDQSVVLTRKRKRRNLYKLKKLQAKKKRKKQAKKKRKKQASLSPSRSPPRQTRL